MGNNDLDKKPTEKCIGEMKSLLSAVRKQNQNTTVHVIPAFERVNKKMYNSKVRAFNEEITKVCDKLDKCMFIENGLISSADSSLFSDGVHFSVLGQKSFVKMIKSHLNPFIGVKPYQDYFRSPKKTAPKQLWKRDVNTSGEVKKLLQQLVQLTNS